ncbi:MAG: ribonucleoside-diphosphate reductase, adenosylcobalamin-dependent [Gammaproteobacteria bacterium RIFCSPHIGHO2_12_FULL_41_20]|nr:MAG: ribonucleoside-diphosphate reductase, adenosylcobalamin-dependent [Gammaproteobacteria bacterium RIFCSPHIGHO2_12_FULL_41_20]
MDSLSTQVWDIKYRYRYQGRIIDHTIADTWQRVAKAIARAEKTALARRTWEKSFYEVLSELHFLPGGRILAGAGTQHHVTLFNCFVMQLAGDSLDAIFNALKEGALTLQQGGGIGYDFSVLRPRGSTVRRAGTLASGPVSFMRIWDTMSETLLATGLRRGAMMGVLRCDHPDIEEFITAKSIAKELRHFNISVMVSDAFMQAVQTDSDWPLVFPLRADEVPSGDIVYKTWSNQTMPVPCRIVRHIRARALWQQIIQQAYDHAEPGVLFEETINRLNNLYYCEHLSATNPCGEIPLPVYGACNLGSINLPQFVIHAFSPQAQLNWAALENTTAIATRFLDDVIDISHYPLKVQKQQALATRRIGLGITGLADALVMLGVRYGSAESLQLSGQIMRRIAEVTWHTSVELAKEKGVFPTLQPAYLRGEFIQKFSSELQEAVAKHGIRNSHHNTIAPAGSISLLAGNVSNGLEPIFQPHYKRHMHMANGELCTVQVTDYALQQWRQYAQAQSLPPAWVDVNTLMPEEHLQMQAAVQPYIDNAISKTINIPQAFPFSGLADIYSKAYALGLKGCTVFRPNPITGSVLVRL